MEAVKTEQEDSVTQRGQEQRLKQRKHEKACKKKMESQKNHNIRELLLMLHLFITCDAVMSCILH